MKTEKERLEGIIESLTAQLRTAAASLAIIKQDERRAQERIENAAREQALSRFRLRMHNRELMKSKLRAAPPSSLNRIHGNESLSWITSLMGGGERIDSRRDLFWCPRMSYWDLNTLERKMIWAQAKELILEIRQERKQAWLGLGSHE